jgi:uncharacterized protein YbbK (DUF523 family)
MTRRPRVGISRCLLGDAVRYDGTSRRQDGILRALDRHVEWVSVCPEVEVGMGVPREPIRLAVRPSLGHQGPPRVHADDVQSGHDWTERLEQWIDARVRDLRSCDLAGYVFKARSPSCGIRGVPVLGGLPAYTDRGRFAQAVVTAFPDLPVADEEDLAEARGLRVFLERVRAYRQGERA